MSADQVAGAIESDARVQLIRTPRPAPDNGSGIEPLRAQVRDYVRASKAANTLRGYQSDWRDFCAWCESCGLAYPMIALTNADLVAGFA